MITLSAELVMWGLLASASFCTFMIGRHIGSGEQSQTIENTILYLVENGFVRFKRTNGEIELLPLEEE